MDKININPDEWRDEEREISLYPELVSLTEYKRTQTATTIDELQVGLVPYLVKPGFSTELLHFKDGKQRTVHRRKKLVLHLKRLKNNFVYTDLTPKYFEVPMLDAYEKEYITPFLLFVDDVFIPWSKIDLVKSDNHLTAIIDGMAYDYKPKDVSILALPTKISYSEDGHIKDSTKIQFRFNEKGLLDQAGKIVVGSTHPKTRVLIYRNQLFSKFKVDVNTKTKLVHNNVVVFTPDGKFSTYYRVNTYSGNLLTIDDPYYVPQKVTAIITYFDESNESEDYLNRFPNNALARAIAAEDKVDIPDVSSIDTRLMRNEFNFSHDETKSYEENINDSIDYVFNYDKNKYDPLFEDNAVVDIREYHYNDIVKRMDSDGWVTMSRDIYPKDNFRNETYVMIFHNNELPDYYKDIVYEHDTFKFKPTNLGVNDFIEIVYFKNVRNEVLPLVQEHKKDKTYLDVSDSYIPTEEVLVYTNKLGDHALCPLNYRYDYETGKVVLPNNEYIDTDLYVGSQNQFRYARIPISKETNAIYLPLYFNTCYNPDKFLLFINGRLLNRIYYKSLIPTLSEPSITFKVIYTMKTVKPGDRVDVFYLGNNIGGGLESYTNNLIIKSIMTFATEDMQTTFKIPLPFKDYDASQPGAVLVMKHGLIKAPETYYLYNENGAWYIKFLDQDDEFILGEELTFLFPYYSTKPYMYSIPTEYNSAQFLPKTITVDKPTKDIDFGPDILVWGGSCMVFKNSDIIDGHEYTVNGTHVVFNETIPAGTDVSIVNTTDKFNLRSNRIRLGYNDFKITSKAQNPIRLPVDRIPDSYMVFFNGKLMDPDDYGITEDKLVIMHRENFNRDGDIVEFVYAKNNSDEVLTVNYYPITLKLIYADFVDIPAFSSISYSKDTMVVFVNGKYARPETYYTDNGTLYFNDGMPIGTEVTIYFAYETINRYYAPYSLSTTIEKNRFAMEEYKVEIEENGQRRFTIPYPELNNEIPFIVHIRGIFIPANNYMVTMDKTAIVFEPGLESKLIKGDNVRFIFVFNGNGAFVNKVEYSNDISAGENVLHLPELFKSEVDYNDYMMVFYGGLYIDKNRYSIDSDNRVLTFKDIPYSNDENRQVSVVLFHTGSDENGTINFLPKSGFLYFDMDKVDRNLTKDNTLIFINGKKIAKHQLIDVTNYLKKLTVDIETRFGMEVLNMSPKVFEFKDKYNEIKRNVKTACVVTIEQKPNQTIKVRNGSNIYSRTFDAKYGDTLDVYVHPVPGYIAGKPSVETVTLTGDITITAEDAKKGDVKNIKIIQTDNQLITVRCNGELYTKSFQEIKGLTYIVSIESTNPKYNCGKLNVTRGVIGDEDITIEATPATVKDVKFEIPDVNLEHQSFVAYLYDDKMENILQTITKPGVYNAKYGQFVSISVTAERGYKPGGLDIFGDYGAIELTKEKKIIGIGAPIGPITYTISIPDFDTQTITVGVLANGDELFDYYTAKSLRGRKAEVLYGDVFDVSISALDTYVAGKLYTNYDNKVTGVFDKDLIISADPAELRTEVVTISVDSDPHSDIKVSLDTGAIIEAGQSMKVIRGTHYTVSVDTDYDYADPALSTWEGVANTDIEVKVLYPSRKLDYADRMNQVYVDLQPKRNAMITVFDKTNNKSHINSFWANYDDELVFKLALEDDHNGMVYSELNVPDTMKVGVYRNLIVTNSYPLSKFQKDYTSYLNRPKGETVNIHIENPMEAFYDIVIINGSDEVKRDMLNIPIGTPISIRLDPLSINPGKLYINGVYIPEGVRTINVGTYDENDILTQCTDITVSASESYPTTTDVDPETREVTVLDRPQAVFVTDSETYEHQAIHLYKYNLLTKEQTELELPHTVNMDQENNLFEYRVISIAEEGYIPGKCNYNIIKPIEGAYYVLDCEEARKLGEENGD